MAPSHSDSSIATNKQRLLFPFTATFKSALVLLRYFFCSAIFSKLYSMISGVTAAIPTEAQSSCSPIPQRPWPNSYWATEMLLACEYPWSPNDVKPKLDAMLLSGVRTYIDLTEDGELLPYVSELPVRASVLGIEPASIEYYRFAIRDRSLPDSVEYMHRIMRVLRDNEAKGRISAVHCRGGIGRTGMVIGCYLVASGRARDGAQALEIIAREWSKVAKSQIYRHSPETGPQFEFVLNFPKSHVTNT